MNCVVRFVVAVFLCLAYVEAGNRDCLSNGGQCVPKTSRKGCAHLKYPCATEKICCKLLTKKSAKKTIISEIKDSKIDEKRLCGKTPKQCRLKAGKCIAVQVINECQGETDDSLCKGASCTCCLGTCQCGQVNGVRIVGGIQVKPKNKYPWMVALFSQLKSTMYYCGGSLINDRYVLTAAHCMYLSYPTPLDAKDISVALADHNQKSTQDDAPGVTKTVAVDSYKVHENYQYLTNNEDIALIKLKEPLDLTAHKQIKPICLPTNPDETYEGVDAIVAGWGLQNENELSSVPEILHEVTVPILSTECKGDTGYYDITENMICAGLPGGGKDACSGDSGGPLFVNEGGTNTLVGIVSFGLGCAEPNAPGVYTRVTMYLDWIKKNTHDALYC